MIKSLKAQEVSQAIMFNGFSNDELDAIIMAVKFRRQTLTDEAKRSFRVGSQVSFVSAKRGQRFTGQVEKVGRKFLTIRTTQGLWRVPGNMLEAV